MKFSSRIEAVDRPGGSRRQRCARPVRLRWQLGQRRRRAVRETRAVTPTTPSPSCPRTWATPYFDTSDKPAARPRPSRSSAASSPRSAPPGGDPRRDRSAFINTADPAGRRRARRVGQRPQGTSCDAHERGTRRRHEDRHVRLRHQTPSTATCSSTRRMPSRHRRRSRSKMIGRADRRRGRCRDPLGRGQRDQPERVDRPDEGRASRPTTTPNIKRRRHRLRRR